MKNLIPLIICAALCCSCEHFLTLKPDKSLAVPSSSLDLQALLDARSNVNEYSGLGEIGSDDYFLPFPNWSSLAMESRLYYIWEKQPVNLIHWRVAYNAIAHFNTVIDLIDDVDYPASGPTRNQIMGRALFYRSNAFFQLMQVFAKPYNPIIANTEKGIVLRLTADINEKSVRASLSQCYDQIISDLKTSALLLEPNRQLYPTRPTKAAAFAALSRTYLSMGEYENSGLYADSCLLLNNELLDYNDIVNQGPYPFDRFNKEVVFFSTLYGDGNLSPSRARVDTLLYATYTDNDLRKKFLFTENPDGYQSFTGNYNPVTSSTLFNGITTAEMLLTRAECYARSNSTELAMQDMLYLLKHRMITLEVDELLELNPSETLAFVLKERRKELIFRGTRWIDIRRLANDERFAVTLTRDLDGEVFTLTPEEQLDFAFYIPLEVIENSDVEQN